MGTQIAIKAKRRETGKKAAKSSRKRGMVPGVFYVKTGEAIPFEVKPLDLRPIVYTSQTKIINLEIEGDSEVRECVLKETQFDPVTDQILHVDFMGIIRGQKITVEVPIVLKGTSKGEREGGILQQSLRSAHISCLPKDLPSALEIDISHLEIGDSVYVKDFGLEHIEIHLSPETAVATVSHPRVVAKVETAGEGEAASEEGGEASTEEKPSAEE